MRLADKFFTALRLPGHISAVLQNLSVQRSFLKKEIYPALTAARATNDGTLDEADFKKITSYYGLAVPAILGEAFCALYGKKMNFAERMASTCQGAMTGLFDDFFDKEYLSDSSIENILSGHNFRSQRSNEKLFDGFYKSALQYVPDKNKMRETLQAVYLAQVKSKKQTAIISEKEIAEITFEKGGTSLLFYRSAFYPFPLR